MAENKSTEPLAARQYATPEKLTKITQRKRRRGHRPHIGFLSVRPDVCRRLPSDSVSRRTPLPLAVTFPLSGRFRDLHPLEYVRAGRTKNSARGFRTEFLFVNSDGKCHHCHFFRLELWTSLYESLASAVSFVLAEVLDEPCSEVLSLNFPVSSICVSIAWVKDVRINT